MELCEFERFGRGVGEGEEFYFGSLVAVGEGEDVGGGEGHELDGGFERGESLVFYGDVAGVGGGAGWRR